MLYLIPNMISISRILITPLIYSQIVTLNLLNVSLLLCYALLSDILDGWLARRFECANDFGIVLDPLCDKIFSIGIYLGFIHNIEISSAIYLGLKVKYIFVGLIIKEIFFMFIATVLMYVCKYPAQLFQASYVGKISFVLNMLSCVAVLFNYYTEVALFILIMTGARSSVYYLRRLLHQIVR